MAALRFGAEGDEKQLVFQGNAQLCRAAGNGGKVLGVCKQIDPPFHTIGLPCGKLCGLFQNGFFGLLHDGQDHFGAALADAAAANRKILHKFPLFNTVKREKYKNSRGTQALVVNAFSP